MIPRPLRTDGDAVSFDHQDFRLSELLAFIGDFLLRVFLLLATLPDSTYDVSDLLVADRIRCERADGCRRLAIGCACRDLRNQILEIGGHTLVFAEAHGIIQRIAAGLAFFLHAPP